MLDALIDCDSHPLIRETRRECMEDYWDMDGVEYVLRGIQSGAVRIREVFLDAPSPLSLPLRRLAEGALMYEYTPSTSKIQSASEEALNQVQMIPPAQEQLDRVSQRARMPEDAKQLHTLLMTEGDLLAGELQIPGAWLDQLARQGRAAYIEPGLWIAKEQEEEYRAAMEDADEEARLHLVRRLCATGARRTPGRSASAISGRRTRRAPCWIRSAAGRTPYCVMGSAIMRSCIPAPSAQPSRHAGTRSAPCRRSGLPPCLARGSRLRRPPPASWRRLSEPCGTRPIRPLSGKMCCCRHGLRHTGRSSSIRFWAQGPPVLADDAGGALFSPV